MKEVLIMKMYADIQILGKVKKEGKNGKIYYYLNYAQENGEIIGQLFVKQKVYDSVQPGEEVTVILKQGEYNGKLFNSVISVK